MAFRKKAKKVAETFQLGEREEPMGGGEEMRNLCQEIPASFDARMKWVADVKRETAELMNGIQARQRERNRETAEMMKGFQRENQQRAREVGNMLGGFHREQEAMAGHWRNMTATMERKRAGKH